MKKFSKQQIKERDDIESDLSDAAEKVRQAIEDYNNEMNQRWAEVAEAVDKFNEQVERAENLINDVVQEIEDYMADKSDKWQESDRAGFYQEWIDALQGIDFSRVEIDQPEQLEEPGELEDLSAALNDLPIELPEGC